MEVKSILLGREAFAGIGLLDGRAVLIKGGRPSLREAAPCADCCHFKIRMFEHDVSVYFSADGANWTQHPRGLEVSGFQTNNFGGFSSLKLGVYAKGSGSVRVEDFRYRAIEWCLRGEALRTIAGCACVA